MSWRKTSAEAKGPPRTASKLSLFRCLFTSIINLILMSYLFRLIYYSSILKILIKAFQHDRIPGLNFANQPTEMMKFDINCLQTCYIFAPEQADFSGPISQRPGKRRKTSQAVNSSVQNEPLHFVPLLSGTENSVSVQTRFGLFVRAWSKQEEPLHVKKSPAGTTSHTDTLDRISCSHQI